MSHDLLIRGGRVIDGSGGVAIHADVAVVAGRISQVRPLIEGDAARVIDASGLVVSPGFIDMHSHADFTLLSNPHTTNAIAQGVTSEVVGNCGWSPAPLGPGDHRGDWLALAAPFGASQAWEWSDFADYLAGLDASAPAVNCIPLVGHGAIRAATLGLEPTEADQDELGRMRGLLSDALSAGAWGLSSGLVYPPGCFAGSLELEALAADVAKAGGIYATHLRDEGANLIPALDEAISLAAQTGVRLQVSHLKAIGTGGHSEVRRAIERLAAARARGISVWWDAYPYEAGSTALTRMLPKWSLVGGWPALADRLGSRRERERIRNSMENDDDSYLLAVGGWDAILLTATHGTGSGRPGPGGLVPELAARSRQDPFDLFVNELALSAGVSTMIVFAQQPAALSEVVTNSDTLIGSDELGVTTPDAQVHPRSYGTFVRMLAMARDGAAGRLEQVVHRMTGLPASVLGIKDRGRIAAGAVADLVVFDPDDVRDRATFASPTQSPTGVKYVFMAGALAIEGEQAVDLGLGRVLRRRRPWESGAA